MKMQLQVLLVIQCCMFAYIASAQPQKDIGEIFKTNSLGHSTYRQIKNLFQIYQPDIILDNVIYYLNSKSETDRQLAIKLIYKVAKNANGEKTKTNATYELVNKGLRDKSPTIIYRCINYLENLPDRNFISKTNNSLASVIHSSTTHFKSLIRLSGRLQMDQLIPYYESKLKNDSTISPSAQWNLRLTLGRLGDQEQVDYCINKVSAIGINDEVIYRLLPDLLYMQHKHVFDYLLEQIAVENNTCTSANPDDEIPIDCSYRLAEAVAPYIKDFPVSTDASGDLKTNDYKQSLNEIRKWIKDNISTYQLNIKS